MPRERERERDAEREREKNVLTRALYQVGGTDQPNQHSHASRGREEGGGEGGGGRV